MAVERYGSVRSAPVKNDSIASLKPVVNRFVGTDAHLMTDQLRSYNKIGLKYASHQSVNHGEKEYARGEVHNNTAESFGAIIERAKQGVFHFWSPKHIKRYLHEIEIRWNHREPELKKTKKGKFKIVMKPKPVIEMIRSLLSAARGRQIRRSANGGIVCFDTALFMKPFSWL